MTRPGRWPLKSGEGAGFLPARQRLVRLIRHQKVAFLLIGGVNVLIGIICFAAFDHLFGHRINYMGVLVLSYAVAIACAFTLQRRLVFKVTGHLWKDLARFTLVNVTALAINAAILPFLVEVVGLRVLVAQLIAISIIVVFNYFGHSMFSFRRTSAPVSSPATPDVPSATRWLDANQNDGRPER